MNRAFCLLAFLAGGMAFLLGIQGWAGRVTTIDLVPHARDAIAFVTSGAMPNHGCISSYGSFVTPGVTWLFVPGIFLHLDPRLIEIPSLILIQILLVGSIWLVALRAFGKSAALLAVVLYCFSAVGMGAARSLWPRNPLALFFIAALYLLVRWISDRRAGFLWGALLVLALGAYVYIEIIPVVVLVPVLWLMYRPPVQSRYGALVIILVVIVWFPYLRFEYQRGFKDLQSQVFKQHMEVSMPETAWGYPELVNQVAGLPLTRVGSLARGSAQINITSHAIAEVPIRKRVGDILIKTSAVIANGVERLCANFTTSEGLSWLGGLSLLMIIGVAMAAFMPVSADAKIARMGLTGREIPLKWAAMTLLAVALIGNEYVVACLLSHDGVLEVYSLRVVRLGQMLLGGVGIILLGLPVISGWILYQKQKCSIDLKVLSIGLFVSWGLMLMLTEAGRFDRFTWLLPAQTILMAGFLVSVVQYSCRYRVLMYGVATLLVLTFCCNPFMISKLKACRKNGWAAQSDIIKTLDGIAEDAGQRRASRITLGYEVPFQPWVAWFHAFDKSYKVGAEWDFYLMWRYGLTNLNTYAEGLSPKDEYRLVDGSSPSFQHVRVPVRNDPQRKLIGCHGAVFFYRRAVMQ